MAVLLWITTTAILTCVVSHYNCDPLSSYNSRNREHQPQKMVEIIELMLSQKPNDSEKKIEILQKVPQIEPSGYSIFISPNKNEEEEPEGSQKIKIFVEADEYDKESMIPQETKTFTFVQPKNEKQNIFEVLPLSIENGGMIIDEYQRTNPHLRSTGDEKSSASYPSKRQTNTGTTQKPKQTSRTTVKANNREEERSTTTTRKEPVRTTTTTTRSTSRHTTHDDYSKKPSTVLYEEKPKPNSYGLGSTIVLTVNEELPLSTSQIEPSYVDQNRPYQASAPKKEEPARPLAYESQYGKSSQNLQPENSDFGYSNPAEETYVKPSQTQQDYARPLANNRKPQPQYEKPQYEERPKPAPPTYEERPVYNREPERPKETRRPVYEREPEDVREEKVSYDREPEVRPTREKRPVYVDEDQYDDQRGRDRRPSYSGSATTSHRPVREDDGYSGFPESYAPANSPAYSRPLQYEPARAFPPSPCLQVFKYEGREPEHNRWYADIYVFTDEVLIGMRLDITLDRPAELLTVNTNWVADVKSKDNVHFTILSLKKRLVPGPAETVRIMVKFDSNKPVPYLTNINLNGRRICPSRSNHAPTVQRTTTRRPQYENPADLQTKRTTEYYPEPPKRQTPAYIDEYEQNTRRTTSQIRTTTTEYYNPNPNPNGYEETDYNDFNRPTVNKGTQTRPSNFKPSSSSGSQNRPSPSNNNNNNNRGTSSSAASSSSSSFSSSSSHHQTSSSSRPTTTNSRPTTHSTNTHPIKTEHSKSIPCGKPSVQPRPLITNGQMTARGQWPWHVALYKNVGADLSYICGGSLISNRHVVTAAHCVTKTYDVKPLDANILVVYLGKYHLKLWSEGGVQNKQVSEVHVHPSYNSTDFRADLAVLTLSSPVEFTEYIRPVCLWDKRSTRIEDIEGKEGTVIGWGFDETKKLTEDLMQAKMPVIKHDVCLWSYPQFFPQFTSNLTYCAGFKNGTSVCNGDSGGGMFFPQTDNNGEQRWHIRGLVSISVKQKDSVLCDLKHYIVFTDLSKFDTWLNNFIS